MNTLTPQKRRITGLCKYSFSAEKISVENLFETSNLKEAVGHISTIICGLSAL